MALPFPIPFGKYLLTDLIAVGGMAEIYRAKIFGVNGFEKQMVVKRILPRYAQNAAFVQMFVDEAKVVVSLAHGNIVPVYELGEVSGNYYIAMEYADGVTALDLLRECYIKNRPLGVAHAMYIAAEVAGGLGYAHTCATADGTPLGIVHRDLNPRNVVVGEAGEVKILDFGIARSSVKKHQTGSGIIKGTPGYMAPEQVLGYSVDARADQYGLAIILHELLTVRRLMSVKDAAEHRTRLAAGPLLPPSHYRPDIPDEVDRVVMKALAYVPEERFPSCNDFEDALRQLIGRTGTPVTSRSLANVIRGIHGAPPAPRPVDLSQKSANITLPLPSVAPPPAAVSAAASVPSAPAPSAPAPSNPTPNAPAPARVKEDFTQELHIPQAAPSPLPLPSQSAIIHHKPNTQVLAINAAVPWAGNIGDDAEMLALARSMGMKSKTPVRLAGALVLVTGLLAGAWAALNPQEVALMLDRAKGKASASGTLLVQSKPSGATVWLDGVQQAARTRMRLDNVMLDVPRTLRLRLPDGREYERVVSAVDFVGPEHRLEVMFEPPDLGDAPDAGHAAPPDAGAQASSSTGSGAPVAAPPKEHHTNKRKKR